VSAASGGPEGRDPREERPVEHSEFGDEGTKPAFTDLFVRHPVLALVVLILHLAAREGLREPSAVAVMPLPLVAVALALDVFRGALG